MNKDMRSGQDLWCRQHTRVVLCLCLWIILVYVGGCNDSELVAIQGTYVGQEDCMKAYFPYQVNYTAMIVNKSSVQLLLHRTAVGGVHDDLMSIVFHGDENPEIGKRYSLTHPEDLNAKVVGKVVTNESCPGSGESYYIDGSVRFDRFSLERGGEVTGTLEGVMKHARTGALVYKDISGSFLLPVSISPPQRFIFGTPRGSEDRNE